MQIQCDSPSSRSAGPIRLLEVKPVDVGAGALSEKAFGGADRLQPLYWIVDQSTLIVIKDGHVQRRRRFDSDIICACECYIDRSYRIAVSLSSGEIYFVHPANDQYDSRGRLQFKVVKMASIYHDGDTGGNTALCLALEDNSIALLYGHQTASNEIMAIARCETRDTITCLKFVAEIDTMLIGCSDGSLFAWKVGSDLVRRLQSASDSAVAHIAYDTGLFHGLVLLVYGPSMTTQASKRYKSSLGARSDRRSCTAVLFALSKLSMALSPIRSLHMDGCQPKLCQYLGSGRDWPTDTHTLDFVVVTGGSEFDHLTVIKVDQRLSSLSSASTKVPARLNEFGEGRIICGLASPYSTSNSIMMACLTFSENGSHVLQATFQHILESEHIMRQLMENCTKTLREPERFVQALLTHGILHERDLAKDHCISLLNCLFRLGLTYPINEYVTSLQSDSERRLFAEWIFLRLQRCQDAFNRLMKPGEFSVNHLDEVYFQLNQLRKFADMIDSVGYHGIASSKILSQFDIIRMLFNLQHPKIDVFGQSQVLWNDEGFRNRYLFRRIIPHSLNQSPPFHFVQDIFRSACSTFDKSKNVVLYMLCAICPDHGYLAEDPVRTAMARTVWNLDEALRSDQTSTVNVSEALKYLSISGSLLSKMSLSTKIVSSLLTALKLPRLALKASRIFRSQGEDSSKQSICLHCQALLENGRFIECLKYIETLNTCSSYLEAFFIWFAVKGQVDTLCGLPLKQAHIDHLGNVLGVNALILCDLYRSRYDIGLSRYTSSAVRQRAIHEALRKYQRAVLPGSTSPIPPPTASSDPLFVIDDGLRARSLFTQCEDITPNAPLPALSFRPAPVGDTLRLEDEQSVVNGMLYPKISPAEINISKNLSQSAPTSETVQLSSTKAEEHDAILTDGAVADEGYSSIEFESDHDEVLGRLNPAHVPVVIDVRGSGASLPEVDVVSTIDQSSVKEAIMDLTQKLEEDVVVAEQSRSPHQREPAVSEIDYGNGRDLPNDSLQHELDVDENGPDINESKSPKSHIQHERDASESAHDSDGGKSRNSPIQHEDDISMSGSLAQSDEGSIEQSSDSQSGQVSVIELSSGSEAEADDHDGSEESSSELESDGENQSGHASGNVPVGRLSMLSAIGSSVIDGIVSVFSGPKGPAEDFQSDIDEMEIDEDLSEMNDYQGADEENDQSEKDEDNVKSKDETIQLRSALGFEDEEDAKSKDDEMQPQSAEEDDLSADAKLKSSSRILSSTISVTEVIRMDMKQDTGPARASSLEAVSKSEKPLKTETLSPRPLESREAQSDFDNSKRPHEAAVQQEPQSEAKIPKRRGRPSKQQATETSSQITTRHRGRATRSIRSEAATGDDSEVSSKSNKSVENEVSSLNPSESLKAQSDSDETKQPGEPDMQSEEPEPKTSKRRDRPLERQASATPAQVRTRRRGRAIRSAAAAAAAADDTAEASSSSETSNEKEALSSKPSESVKALSNSDETKVPSEPATKPVKESEVKTPKRRGRPPRRQASETSFQSTTIRRVRANSRAREASSDDAPEIAGVEEPVAKENIALCDQEEMKEEEKPEESPEEERQSGDEIPEPIIKTRRQAKNTERDDSMSQVSKRRTRKPRDIAEIPNAEDGDVSALTKKRTSRRKTESTEEANPYDKETREMSKAGRHKRLDDAESMVSRTPRRAARKLQLPDISEELMSPSRTRRRLNTGDAEPDSQKRDDVEETASTKRAKRKKMDDDHVLMTPTRTTRSMGKALAESSQ